MEQQENDDGYLGNEVGSNDFMEAEAQEKEDIMKNAMENRSEAVEAIEQASVTVNTPCRGGQAEELWDLFKKATAPTASTSASTSAKKSVGRAEIVDLLAAIPSDLPYSDWYRVAAALKNEDLFFEVFDEWSKTCPEKYDAEACKKTWDSVGGPDHPEITVKTLYYLRAKYGKPAIPPPSAPLACPGTDEELQEQSKTFLALLFAEDENVELVVTLQTRPGIIAPWPEALKELQKRPVNNGAWFTINPVKLPLRGKAASNEDIGAFRYALVEADEGTLEEQWAAFTSLPVIPPVKAVVWSGGKSAHFIVEVDAPDPDEYKKRVESLYDYCRLQGVKVDAANKNPSRLTRLPGVRRGNDAQYLLAEAFGSPDWKTFAAQIAPKVIDRRALTSPINGQNGGRPQLDTKAYADQFMAELEGRGGKLIFWKNDSYLYERGRWNKMPSKELDGSLSRFLQEACPTGFRISKSLVTDVRTCLEANYVRISKCPEAPFLIKEEVCMPDCMIFQNVAVRLKDLEPHLLAECPVIKKSSNLFGEDDVTYDFDPRATCPEWEKAVEAWFPDEADQKMLQGIFAYIIGRSTSLNCCFFFVGEAGTGKSTVLKVLRALVGEKRCSAVALEQLRGRFNTARLAASFLNTQEEMPTGGALRGQNSVESLLKTATDGGTVQIELKGVDPVDGRISARFVFCGNELPKFADPTDGLWDRLVLLEFSQRIRWTQNDRKEYADILKQELPGIFNWAVEGLKDLRGCKRFPVSDHSKALLDDLRKRCDLEGSFAREMFTQAMGHETPLKNVMAAYDEYVQTYNGMQKAQEAVKAALQRVFPYVKFKRARVFPWGEVPVVVNLMFRDDEDEFPLYPGFLQQGESPIAPEPEQKTAEAAEKAPSMDCEERPLPEKGSLLDSFEPEQKAEPTEEVCQSADGDVPDLFRWAEERLRKTTAPEKKAAGGEGLALPEEDQGLGIPTAPSLKFTRGKRR